MFERWYPLAVTFGVLKQAPETFASSHRVFFVRWGINLVHILPVCGTKLLLDFMLNGLPCVQLIHFPHEAFQWRGHICQAISWARKPMWFESLDTRGQFLSKTRPQIIYWQITVSRMHDRVYIFRQVFLKAIVVCFSVQGNHLTFLFVDCCFDITLNKHRFMITNTWDDLSLDDKTVVVGYKQV